MLECAQLLYNFTFLCCTPYIEYADNERAHAPSLGLAEYCCGTIQSPNCTLYSHNCQKRLLSSQHKEDLPVLVLIPTHKISIREWSVATDSDRELCSSAFLSLCFLLSVADSRQALYSLTRPVVQFHPDQRSSRVNNRRLGCTATEPIASNCAQVGSSRVHYRPDVQPPRRSRRCLLAFRELLHSRE